MKNLLWRIQFTLAVVWIFSKPKGAFKGNHFKLGWKVSKTTKYKKLTPFKAAVEEITEWYVD